MASIWMSAMAGYAHHDLSGFAQDQRPPSDCLIACEAIDQGKCLELVYEDFSRIIEVHRVGISPVGAPYRQRLADPRTSQ